MTQEYQQKFESLKPLHATPAAHRRGSAQPMPPPPPTAVQPETVKPQEIH